MDPLQECRDDLDHNGPVRLGAMIGHAWRSDPKRLAFTLSRYKFVSKMLCGRNRVLEVGCGDAFNAPIVMQEVRHLTVTDFDAEFIADAKERMPPEYPYEALVHDFLDGPVAATFDAAYSLDVIEHIDARDELRFIGNIMKCLTSDAVMIIGMPSLESQVYASPGSKAGHINCKTAPDLRALMENFFHSVFMFSMNDEVIHTGYHKMAHYILAVAAHRRELAPES
jgi:cyclopropane fatty-acyl-phospholipid synthase-like methyltransferase